MLNVLNEHSRESLAIVPARCFSSSDVIDALADLALEHGPPEHIRSDNGPEFIGKALRKWLGSLGVRTLYIEPDSPWENGFIESFNARLRDELLNGEVFETIAEAKAVTDWWREHYNRQRPHSSLGYQPPAPETIPGPETTRTPWPPRPLGFATLRLPPGAAMASEARIN